MDYVEAGRVTFINYYDHYGKLLVILDILNAQKSLFDSLNNFSCVLYLLKSLKLTHIKLLEVFRRARTVTAAAAAKEFNLDAGLSKTSYAKIFYAEKERSARIDFYHWKIMFLRKQGSFATKTKMLSQHQKRLLKLHLLKVLFRRS